MLTFMEYLCNDFFFSTSCAADRIISVFLFFFNLLCKSHKRCNISQSNKEKRVSFLAVSSPVWGFLQNKSPVITTAWPSQSRRADCSSSACQLEVHTERSPVEWLSRLMHFTHFTANHAVVLAPRSVICGKDERRWIIQHVSRLFICTIQTWEMLREAYLLKDRWKPTEAKATSADPLWQRPTMSRSRHCPPAARWHRIMNWKQSLPLP